MVIGPRTLVAVACYGCRSGKCRGSTLRRLAQRRGPVFPGVDRGFAAHTVRRLFPHHFAELRRWRVAIDKIVRHINAELEGQREAVVVQTAAQKDAFRIAHLRVAMADGLFRQRRGVDRRNQRVVSCRKGVRIHALQARARQCQWHKQVAVTLQPLHHCRWHHAHQPLQVCLGVKRTVQAAQRGKAQTIGRHGGAALVCSVPGR